MNTLSDLDLPNGTVITGNWRRKQYRVEKLLGEGANGRVFLVSRGSGLYALKIGRDVLDHQSEVNVLKQLSRASSFRGFLTEADDYVQEGAHYPYYVMKYVRGRSPSDYIRLQGSEWLSVIGLHLLRKLHDLHRQGFIFGDLKLENVLVTTYGGAELIDFGGVTQKGNAVKQFTEVYDRGYWGAGSRTADESYDLFSFAMLCIQLVKKPTPSADYANMLPQNRSLSYLIEEIRSSADLGRMAPFLEKALKGSYTGTEEAIKDWRMLGLEPSSRPSLQTNMPWLKISFGVALLLFVSTLCLYWR